MSDSSTQAAVRSAIIALADNASIEINPDAALTKPELLTLIPANREIFVTHLPGKDFADTIATCKLVAGKGAIPVAHIGSRSVPSLSALDKWLGALCSETPTQRLLLIGGGGGKLVGAITQTMDILESGLLDNHPLSHLYFAAHPEGNLFAPEQSGDQVMLAKQEWAAKQKYMVAFVTQFGFDVDLILKWEKHVRNDLRITLPIRLGLPGKASLKSLLHFAKLCGVKNSLGFLRKRTRSVADLLTKRGPEDQLAPLARALIADRANLFNAIHVFPLGGFKTSLLWLKQLEDGTFAVDGQQLHFTAQTK